MPVAGRAFVVATPEARARADAYVRASNEVHRQNAGSQVDKLLERSRARLERELRGSGPTAWQPFTKPTSLAADMARQHRRQRIALRSTYS